MKNKYLFLSIFFLSTLSCFGQVKKNNQAKGSLFIIGGGDRSASLMQAMIATAHLQASDYIVVLPMSGENPDTSFFNIREDIMLACTNTIVNFNFTKEKINDVHWLDSLQHAKLIFITGGDQSRFMDIVLHTTVYAAIHKAFANGATIAGTSAGAAMMSKKMITGRELLGDSIGTGPFTKINYNMVEVKEGLGLMNTAIIDQHFIIRSRYNRLLSVLAANPSVQCIGIDEATAIIVQGKKVTVTGKSQVIRMLLPAKKNKKNGETEQVKIKNIQMDILIAGDFFMLD